MTSFIRLIWLALMGVWLTACSGSQNASKETAFVEYIGHASFRFVDGSKNCLLYTSPSPRDLSTSRMPSSA